MQKGRKRQHPCFKWADKTVFWVKKKFIEKYDLGVNGLKIN